MDVVIEYRFYLTSSDTQTTKGDERCRHFSAGRSMSGRSPRRGMLVCNGGGTPGSGCSSTMGRTRLSGVTSGRWPLRTGKIEDYEEVARQFRPEPGCTRQWAKLAAEAGMKYMVLTTRHHEGFSLWDSKVNPYNVVAHSGGFDVVKEFVASCREFGLRTGFTSL